MCKHGFLPFEPYAHWQSSSLVLGFESLAWFEAFTSERLFGVVGGSCDILDDGFWRFADELLV
jgi:hypothetical protein